MSIIHVVSVSSGIDSQATLEMAVERFGLHRVRAIFCDTDNEDQAVYDHLDYPDWERIVSMASKRGYSTFFHKVDGLAGMAVNSIFKRNEVWQVIEWAKTSRGGRQFSFLTDLDEPAECSSSYGLCG